MYSIVDNNFSCKTEKITAVIKAKVNKIVSRFVNLVGVVLVLLLGIFLELCSKKPRVINTAINITAPPVSALRYGLFIIWHVF